MSEHKEDEIVLEVAQRRENDEYDTDEDAPNYQVDPEDFRKLKEEELRRSAMLLDRRQSAPKLSAMSPLWRNQKRAQSDASYLLLDDDDDEESLNRNGISGNGIYGNRHEVDEVIHFDANRGDHDIIHLDDDNGNGQIFGSPIPRDPKDRFSVFMTDIYVQRKRMESEDVSNGVSNGVFNGVCNGLNAANGMNSNLFQSPSFSEGSYSNRSASNLREHSLSSKTANSKTQKLSVSGRSQSAILEGDSKRNSKRDSVRDWHRGLEINWRTTPLPPRDDGKLLKEQRGRCASCGSELKRTLLSASRYHYCRFTGLIHCVECHRKDRAVIPHRVLHELDCRPSYVCCAAKQYLDRMHSIPCITLKEFGQNEKVQNHPKLLKRKKVSVCGVDEV